MSPLSAEIIALTTPIPIMFIYIENTTELNNEQILFMKKIILNRGTR
jgi:hypothetical protein